MNDVKRERVRRAGQTKCAPPQTSKHWQDFEGLAKAKTFRATGNFPKRKFGAHWKCCRFFPLRQLHLTLAFEDIRLLAGCGSMHHRFRTRVEGLARLGEILSLLSLCVVFAPDTVECHRFNRLTRDVTTD